MLFNFTGWKKNTLYIFSFGIVYLTDVVCSIICFQYITYNLILGVSCLFYITMMYLSAICVGIDKKTSNLILLVFFIVVCLVIGLNLVPFFGLEELFGYLVILFDILTKRILFALQLQFFKNNLQVSDFISVIMLCSKTTVVSANLIPILKTTTLEPMTFV